MIALLALALAAEVQLHSEDACVDRAAIDSAIDEVGGLDVAERLVVLVQDHAHDEEGRARLRVGIEIELVAVAPLHRDVVIRPFECDDIPTLVALLVMEQRAAPQRARRTATPPAPELPRRSRNDRLYVPSYSSCSGPTPCAEPPSGVGTLVGLQVGPTLVASTRAPPGVGLRAHADVTMGVSEAVAVIVAGEAATGSDGRALFFAAGGAAARWPIEAVTLSLRGTVGVGALGDSLRGHPVTTLVVVPAVAARAQLGWGFLEAGAQVHGALLPGGATWLGVGLNL